MKLSGAFEVATSIEKDDLGNVRELNEKNIFTLYP